MASTVVMGMRIAGDVVSDPSYAATAVAGAVEYVWSDPTSDGRALQITAVDSTDRIAAADDESQFLVDITCSDTAMHTVAAYVLDWDLADRDELIEMIDVGTGAVLDTRYPSSEAGVTI